MQVSHIFNLNYIEDEHPIRTCGYVVGTRKNKGGLTRHLSLVHQRQYRQYTAKMEQNWTNGMMEKNLNMKIPNNF